MGNNKSVQDWNEDVRCRSLTRKKCKDQWDQPGGGPPSVYAKLGPAQKLAMDLQDMVPGSKNFDVEKFAIGVADVGLLYVSTKLLHKTGLPGLISFVGGIGIVIGADVLLVKYLPDDKKDVSYNDPRHQQYGGYGPPKL